MLPEAFLIADELIEVTRHIVDGLVVDESAIERNLSMYAPFAGTERVLMALGKAGADRQMMHERLRELAMNAWASVEKGQGNPLSELIPREPDFLEYLTADKLRELLNASQYLGDAPDRARELSRMIQEAVS
jgi:adenylosuccinate lyase